jgi:hypothetical protein
MLATGPSSPCTPTPRGSSGKSPTLRVACQKPRRRDNRAGGHKQAPRRRRAATTPCSDVELHATSTGAQPRQRQHCRRQYCPVSTAERSAGVSGVAGQGERPRAARRHIQTTQNISGQHALERSAFHANAEMEPARWAIDIVANHCHNDRALAASARPMASEFAAVAVADLKNLHAVRVWR